VLSRCSLFVRGEEVADDKTTEEAKKERQRSPNYPAVGLRDAVERVRKLYTEDGRAGAPPKIAAVHIGFKAPHGQAMSVLAALKRFGLVSEVNGRIAPTHAAIEILNLPESDPRRKAALREAALGPPIYRELVDNHRVTGLPKRDVLEAELVTYKKFNPSAVKAFVTDFLDTLEYAGISVEDGVSSTGDEESKGVNIGDFVQWVSQGQDQFRELKKVVRFSDDGEYAFFEGEKTGAPVRELEVGDAPESELPPPPPMRNPQRRQQAEGSRSMRQDVFSLDDGGEVTISWPVPLTADMITDIKDWLKIVERKIARSVAEPKQTEAEAAN
jgi:hypothetical protein